MTPTRRSTIGRRLRLALLLAAAASPVVANHPYPGDPPLAERISVSAPNASGEVAVVGAPGAAPPGSHVLLVTLQTGRYARTTAAGDGGFSTALRAPHGASILVKVDLHGAELDSLFQNGPTVDFHANQLFTLPGTLVQVREPPPTANGIPFATAGVVQPLTEWMLTGVLNRRDFSPGATVQVDGTLEVSGAALATVPNLSFRAALGLVALTDAAGRPKLAHSSYASTYLTPTGLPIERLAGAPFGFQINSAPLSKVGPTTFRKPVSLQYLVPPNQPAGWYRPNLTVFFEGMPPPEAVTGQAVFTFIDNAQRRLAGLGPTVRIGTPPAPRFPATLLANELSGGGRGATAIEDRGAFEVAPRIVTAVERFVVPRLDPNTDQPVTYRLEPFALTLGLGDRGSPPAPPLVPLRFPSGALTVTIESPGGAVTMLGPAPFRQFHLIGPGSGPREGGGHISDPFALTTLDPRFDVRFTEEGLHRIRVEATVDDHWGTRWRTGGTYELYVARPLVLDTAVLPGTPFEVGDAFHAALVVHPPFPASVEVRVRFAPRSDASRLATWTVRGLANRFGYRGPSGAPLRFAEPGEYRADVTATYRDPAGGFWAGTRTFGGVVAPRSTPILAHGRRGIDDQHENRQAWFFRTDTPSEIGRSHIIIPFHSGDVMWMQESDAAIPLLTFQDPGGDIVDFIEEAGILCCTGFSGPGPVEERFASGEAPLVSFNRDHSDPQVFAPAELIAYAYISIQRPLIRVRELIAEDAGPGASYWRFSDFYGGQTGNGPFGDLPNEIKFQFGGAVVRGKRLASPLYAAYASLFVLVPESDPAGGSRVFPPFQGNGGGPSGGPIMILKGRAIDLFWHLTALRPGSILELGNRASFAGYFGPPLAGKLTLTVTSPSGKVRNLFAQANRVGYLYDPGLDFFPDETGIWKVLVQGRFDGRTSAGQVQSPYPSGDVLGTAAGEFHFYVVERAAEGIAVSLPVESFVSAGELPLHVPAIPPAGLVDRKLHVTTLMPGFLLENLSSSSFTYRYDPVALGHDFPNLDPPQEGDGAAGFDMVNMSLLASGTDNGGQPRYRARQLLLRGADLFVPLQDPAAPCANTNDSLCLSSGRFLLRIRWRDGQGRSGVGHAVPLTADSGYFWFFRPDNVEVLVKALNACGFPGNPNFWIFAAGLTNVETTLEVTDTHTGEVRFYDNPLGKAFAPLQDTAAFPTCGAPASAPILAASSTLSPQLSPPGGGEKAHIAAAAGTEAGAAAASTCAPSPTALCLAGGRFRVEATWKTPSGQSGSGRAAALTQDTGYFWFFRSDNVEVITKVLNACSFPGKPRFWTFAAGLTNVEVKLKVTDTQTGQVREYKNPLNRPFQPIQDTSAFASCP